MKLKLLIIFLLVAAGIPMTAQINIPNATAVTQNFDGMAATTTLPTNWKVAASNASPTWAAASAVVTQIATGSSSSAGGTYNFGNTTSERAVGAMTSGSFGSPNSVIGYFRNTNALMISNLAISYNGERYRINAAVASIQFFYSYDGTTWTAVTAGDIAAASFPTAASSYTFASPLSVPVSFNITGLSLTTNSDIYLRWNINTGGSNSQGIAIDDVSVAATFSAGCSAPSNQASAPVATNFTTVGADLSWTNASGATGSMVVIRPTAQADAVPASGTSYIANSNYATAGAVNVNNKVVYRGTGTAITGITGLTPGTQYTATIYAYNDPGSCYNTTAPETVTFYTLAAEPTAYSGAATFSCATISVTQINLTFARANTITNARGYMILARIGAPPTGVPIDGADYAPGTVFGDATVIGEVTSATATTFSATGLNAGSTYYFSLIPYGATVGVPATYNYRTVAGFLTTNCTTTTAPEINVRGLIGTNPTIADGSTIPQGTNNTQFTTTAVGSSQPKSFRIENVGNAGLIVSGVSIVGLHPGDFSLSAMTFPLNIAVGAHVDFTITFSPTVGGLRSATVNINSNDSDEALYDFAIEGTGDAAEIDILGNGMPIVSGTLTTDLLNHTKFGNVNVASGSVTRIFTISNLGTLSLTLSPPVISGPGASNFTITTTPATTLSETTSTTLVITFDPSTVGDKNATVTIANSDSNENPYTFAISGRGVDFVLCTVGPLETLAQQDFEVAPATPVFNYTYFQDPLAIAPTIGGGTGRGSSRTVLTNKFIGSRSFQVAGHAGNSTDGLETTVEFATVDASLWQDISLSFKLGAYAATSGATIGLDAPDKVTVFVSANGGSTWSEELAITGFSNAIWDITSPGTASANFDGNNIVTSIPAANFLNSINVGPSNISLTNLPSVSSLKIRIVLKLDRSDEIWVIDNVKLSAKKPLSTTWSTAWSAGAPTNSVKAIFAGDYNAGVNVEACACEISSGVTVNVADSKYIEIQSDIVNSGTISIANNGSLIQVDDQAIINGDATVERQTTPYDQYDYTYWSSPVFEPTIGTTFPDMRTDHSYSWITSNFVDANGDGFDDAAPWAWNLEGPTAVMKKGVGYIVRASSTSGTWPRTSNGTFSGVLNNGIVSVPTSMSPNPADSNSLVGNPYASAISADDFIDLNTNIDGTLYFWTHVDNVSPSHPGPYLSNFSSDDYAVYTKMGGTGTRGAILHPTHPISGKTTAPTGKIASGQGFYVTMLAPTPIVFNNALRSKAHVNTDFFKTTGPEEKDRVWLNLYNEDQMFSQQLVGYADEATLGKDRGYDGPLSNAGNYINFYSMIGNERFKIQGRPTFNASDEVPLGYFSAVDDVFKIEIDSVEGQLRNISHIYLQDRDLQVFHDLKQGPYLFATQKGTFDNRFVIRYTNEILGNSGFEIAANDVLVVANDKIEVKSLKGNIQKIQVFDVLGRMIYTNPMVNQREFVIENIAKTQSALIVKVTLENEAEATKKIRF